MVPLPVACFCFLGGCRAGNGVALCRQKASKVLQGIGVILDQENIKCLLQMASFPEQREKPALTARKMSSSTADEGPMLFSRSSTLRLQVGGVGCSLAGGQKFLEQSFRAARVEPSVVFLRKVELYRFRDASQHLFPEPGWGRQRPGSISAMLECSQQVGAKFTDRLILGWCGWVGRRVCPRDRT